MHNNFSSDLYVYISPPSRLGPPLGVGVGVVVPPIGVGRRPTKTIKRPELRVRNCF